jgi:hypothetical protein
MPSLIGATCTGKNAGTDVHLDLPRRKMRSTLEIIATVFSILEFCRAHI